MKVIVTGGSGFIGSALVIHLLERTGHEVLNIDKLTYAANPASLAVYGEHPRYQFRQVDISDFDGLNRAFQDFQPDAVIHLAAESHVDRSIMASREFIGTNILGTHTLLEVSRSRFAEHSTFRLVHVSTDEVFGDLGPRDPAFTESSPYLPRSPYSASKAGSDHLVRAWSNTYGLPAVVIHSSNCFGPRQHPEKLIPRMILSAISGQPLPIYGDGKQIRDWLHVADHVEALALILESGQPDETYNVGGGHEMRNLDLVTQLCGILDEFVLDQCPPGLSSYKELIQFVEDRPGHDRRYGLDTSKIRTALGWSPRRDFDSALRDTVRWYLTNEDWWCASLCGITKSRPPEEPEAPAPT